MAENGMSWTGTLVTSSHALLLVLTLLCGDITERIPWQRKQRLSPTFRDRVVETADDGRSRTSSPRFSQDSTAVPRFSPDRPLWATNPRVVANNHGRPARSRVHKRRRAIGSRQRSSHTQATTCFRILFFHCLAYLLRL